MQPVLQLPLSLPLADQLTVPDASRIDGLARIAWHRSAPPPVLPEARGKPTLDRLLYAHAQLSRAGQRVGIRGAPWYLSRLAACQLLACDGIAGGAHEYAPGQTLVKWDESMPCPPVKSKPPGPPPPGPGPDGYAYWSEFLGWHGRAQYPEIELRDLYTRETAPPRAFADPPADSKPHTPWPWVCDMVNCGFWKRAPDGTPATCTHYCAWNGKKWIGVCNCRHANHSLSPYKPCPFPCFSAIAESRTCPVCLSARPVWFYTRDIGACYPSTLLPSCLQGKFVLHWGGVPYEYCVMPFGYNAAPLMLYRWPVSAAPPPPPGVTVRVLADDAQGVCWAPAPLASHLLTSWSSAYCACLESYGYVFPGTAGSRGKNMGLPATSVVFAGIIFHGLRGYIHTVPSVETLRRLAVMLMLTFAAGVVVSDHTRDSLAGSLQWASGAAGHRGHAFFAAIYACGGLITDTQLRVFFTGLHFVAMGDAGDAPRKLSVQHPHLDASIVRLHARTPAGSFFFGATALMYVDGDAASRHGAAVLILPDGSREVRVWDYGRPCSQSQIELYALLQGLLWAADLFRTRGLRVLVLGDNTSAQDSVHLHTSSVSIPLRSSLLRWFEHRFRPHRLCFAGRPLCFAKAPGGSANPADPFARRPLLASSPLAPLDPSRQLLWSVFPLPFTLHQHSHSFLPTSFRFSPLP